MSTNNPSVLVPATLTQESQPTRPFEEKMPTPQKTTTSTPNFLKRLGAFSLVSLFLGSTGLILAAINYRLGAGVYIHKLGVIEESTIRDNYTFLGLEHPPPPPSTRMLRFGNTFLLQYWLILVGLCVSSTLYGLSQAWIHLFDTICTRRARGYFPWKNQNLDYGRYLNSLPNAPVTSGLRSGFWGMVVVKYMLISSSALLTVAYKLIFISVPGRFDGQIDVSGINWRQSSYPLRYSTASVLTTYGDLSDFVLEGWSDGLQYGRSRAFDYTYPEFYGDGHYGSTEWNASQIADWDLMQNGPPTIILNSIPDCAINSVFETKDFGVLSSSEIVLLATRQQKMDRNGMGGYVMTAQPRAPGRTRRIKVESRSWGKSPHDPKAKATRGPFIIEYSIFEQGWFELKWSRYFEGWDCGQENINGVNCNDTDQALIGYVSYNLTFGISQVKRVVEGDKCQELGGWKDTDGPSRGIVHLSDTSPFRCPRSSNEPESKCTAQNSTMYIPATLASWIENAANAPGGDPIDTITTVGKLALLEAAKYIRGDQDNEWPSLGPFNITSAQKVGYYVSANEQNNVKFTGRKASFGTIVVCHQWGADVMLAVGIIGLVALILRIAVGPPEITSWAAQHLQLASGLGGTGLSLGMFRDTMYGPMEVNRMFVTLDDGPKFRYLRRTESDKLLDSSSVSEFRV